MKPEGYSTPSSRSLFKWLQRNWSNKPMKEIGRYSSPHLHNLFLITFIFSRFTWCILYGGRMFLLLKKTYNPKCLICGQSFAASCSSQSYGYLLKTEVWTSPNHQQGDLELKHIFSVTIYAWVLEHFILMYSLFKHCLWESLLRNAKW